MLGVSLFILVAARHSLPPVVLRFLRIKSELDVWFLGYATIAAAMIPLLFWVYRRAGVNLLALPAVGSVGGRLLIGGVTGCIDAAINLASALVAFYALSRLWPRWDAGSEYEGRMLDFLSIALRDSPALTLIMMYLAALIEETLSRKLNQELAYRAFGSWVLANVYASMIFTLAHEDLPLVIRLSHFGGSLVLGAVYARNRSLLTASTAHCLCNVALTADLWPT